MHPCLPARLLKQTVLSRFSLGVESIARITWGSAMFPGRCWDPCFPSGFSGAWMATAVTEPQTLGEHLQWATPFSPPRSFFWRLLVVSPLYIWGNWGWERCGDSLQGAEVWDGIQSLVCWQLLTTGLPAQRFAAVGCFVTIILSDRAEVWQRSFWHLFCEHGIEMGPDLILHAFVSAGTWARSLGEGGP